jgi:type IV secretory pathway VirB2 component (pilin)
MTRKSIVTNLAIAAVVAIAIVAATDSAFASGSGASGIFSTLQSKASTTFTNVRNVAFVVAGFGIIAVAVMAFFGRFNFKHLAGLIGGLVLISAAAAFINYVTGQDSSGTISNSTGITDSFGAN